MNQTNKLLNSTDYYKFLVVQQIETVSKAASLPTNESSTEEFINSVQTLETLCSILFGFNGMQYTIDYTIDTIPPEEIYEIRKEAHIRFKECLKFVSLWGITPKLNESIMADIPGTIDYDIEEDTIADV